MAEIGGAGERLPPPREEPARPAARPAGAGGPGGPGGPGGAAAALPPPPARGDDRPDGGRRRGAGDEDDDYGRDRWRDRGDRRDRDRDRDRDRRRERSRSRSRDRRDRRDRHDRQDGRGEGRGRERERRRAPSPPRGPLPEHVVIGDVYRGRVQNVRDIGAFVRIEGLARPLDGLVHVSQLESGRTERASDVVRTGQGVYVKVLSVKRDEQGRERIGLSMKDACQETGRDLNPPTYGDGGGLAGEDPMAGLGRSNLMADMPPPAAPRDTLKGLSGIQLREEDPGEEALRKRRRKRLTTPERFEAKQLIASGVLRPEDYPGYDEEFGLQYASDDEHREEFEVDMNEVEPAFLKGCTTRAGIELSPVRVVKNPDGAMQRAAMTSSQLARERRELKQQQQKAVADAIPKNVGLAWLDPMADGQERVFADELRQVGMSAALDNPEWKKKADASAPVFGKQDTRTIKEQRESLPIFGLKDALVDAVNSHQVLVVIGETGSGKTTQMTQYLAEAGYTAVGKIGCTQPRRVAAMSVAQRVAEEFGCRLGEEVGYAIRFEDVTSPQTVIKYMTDGMLLRECLLDDTLSNYSVIILDEAHERTINTDVLFGLIKGVLTRRKDLKLIATSATLDAEKFSSYFWDCPIFRIPGRTFPVEVLWAQSPESDYLDGALMTVMKIHLTEPEGDILLFLTGMEEIETACETLFERMKALGPSVPELIVLPVYSSLPSEMQTKIFEPAPPGKRKCVVATNIAEASITIDGIYYVVDPGMCKVKAYNPKLGMDSLVVAPISQASAKQRAGRAGRTGPGKCYRLYTEAAFKNEMLPTSVPEIQRTNLSMTVLTMKAMGINDLLHFDFMDAPPAQTLITSLEQLYNLGALDEEGLLTRLGRKMAEFPLEPPMSKMLITSVDLGCSDEILTVIAMLSAENIFYRPRDKQSQADQKKSRFVVPEGDHLTLLNVYEAWKASGFSTQWCYENFIQGRSMRRAQDIRKQLLSIMDRYKLDIVSAGANTKRVQKCIVGGYFFHAARKDAQEGYRTVIEQTPVYIHPSSTTFQSQPDWVIYHNLVMTTKEYMREVMQIDPKWLVELAPRYFKEADANKLSRRKQRERIEPLFNKFEEPNLWRLSKRFG